MVQVRQPARTGLGLDGQRQRQESYGGLRGLLAIPRHIPRRQAAGVVARVHGEYEARPLVGMAIADGLRAASAHGRGSTGARDKIQIGLDNDRENAYT